MTRGKHRGRGGSRGNRGGRGYDRGGGRGARGGGGSARGHGRGRGLAYWIPDEIDDDIFVDIHPKNYAWRGSPLIIDHEPHYSDSSAYQHYSRHQSGRGSSRGQGPQRGRGQWGLAGPDTDPFEPRDFLRKRNPGSKQRYENASLSQLLYEDRPYLKPITFVRSKMTPTLFLRDDDIFKPVAEEAGEQGASRVPTADRVYRIFHGGNPDPQPSELLPGEEKIKTKNAAATAHTGLVTISNRRDNQLVVATTDQGSTGFYIDTKPSPVQESSISTNDIAVDHPSTGILGEDSDDDEIIVYPQLSREPVPEPEPKPVPKEAVLAPPPAPAPAPAYKDSSFSRLSSFSKPTHRARLLRRTARRKAERRASERKTSVQKAMFSLRGAMLAEASLREQDPRSAEQRRGDSDIDWGDSTSEVAEAEDSDGMLVDRDIKADAMISFVRSMDVGGHAHTSAGDLEDEERIRLEDADEEDEGESASDSDEDVDTELELADGLRGILAAEDEDEGQMASRSSLADDDDDDDDDDTSEDEGVTPRRSFQARLERIRSRNAGRTIKDMMQDELDQDREVGDDMSSDSNSDSDFDDEGSIITQIEVRQSYRLTRRYRRVSSIKTSPSSAIRTATDKPRLQAINNGKFGVNLDDFIDASPKRKKDKHKHIPAELQEQWGRDRARKAERKRLRDTSISLDTVVKHMRAFVTDLDAASTISLPPMARQMRKSVHDLAHAFNLKSKSEGNGPARFTKLSKTTRSGVRIDERKIAQILGKPDRLADSNGGRKGKGKGKGKAGVEIRPRDGEVVGGAAPMIDGSNGTRIGVVGGGGLDVPLLGVIKTTKLGLGASSRRG
ncbi:hypothetical protein EI94DRAFT_1728370 [Lactarius quietus]|nr:hypothetical protein EI94DRAFT_1728370 [Lactarius quietus]